MSSGGNTGGWGGGRPGGGGGFDNGDYSNPKAIKSVGNLTINNGTYTITCANEGGEGLESKAILTINGGTIDISTKDDCINASNHIQINGGIIRCVANNNDAIDSNGTITIAGGYILAAGANSPECAFDCDNNTFAITGGVIFGMGGSGSSPTSSKCQQKVAIYNGGSTTTGNKLTLVNSAGEQLMTVIYPASLQSSSMVISSPLLTDGSYSLYSGGSIEGGEDHLGLITGATYTPGTLLKTFTPTSMVTTIR